jgi:tetratricopeptide (TPR) repeat protein
MRTLEAAALHNLGMSLARLGNLDEGIDYQRQAARIADECNAFRLQIHTRVYESVFLVWRGAPGDLGAALSIARYIEGATRDHPALQIEGSFLLGHVQLARRALDAAIEAAREANQRLLAGPVEEWEEFIRLSLVEALLAAGEEEEADAVLQAAFQALVDRVESIRRQDHRTAFIQRNEEVRRLVELARERLGHEPPRLSGFP